jgi:hypothetical protein
MIRRASDATNVRVGIAKRFLTMFASASTVDS